MQILYKLYFNYNMYYYYCISDVSYLQYYLCPNSSLILLKHPFTLGNRNLVRRTELGRVEDSNMGAEHIYEYVMRETPRTRGLIRRPIALLKTKLFLCRQ